MRVSVREYTSVCILKPFPYINESACTYVVNVSVCVCVCSRCMCWYVMVSQRGPQHGTQALSACLQGKSCKRHANREPADWSRRTRPASHTPSPLFVWCIMLHSVPSQPCFLPFSFFCLSFFLLSLFVSFTLSHGTCLSRLHTFSVLNSVLRHSSSHTPLVSSAHLFLL